MRSVVIAFFFLQVRPQFGASGGVSGGASGVTSGIRVSFLIPTQSEFSSA